MNAHEFEHTPLSAHESADALRAYIAGCIISLACTLLGYFLVTHLHLPREILIPAIIFLASVQCVAQAVCFLHLGIEKRSRPELIVLGFAVLVISILLSGSLWIMFDLNGRMMADPAQMQQYMQDQGGF